MSDAPGSQEPLVCPRCLPLERSLAEREEALRVLSAELEERAIEIAGLQLHLRRAGQAEVALRNQLKQATDEDTDQDQVIRTLCDAWKRLLGHPRAKTPKTGARWKIAKAALRHHSPEECMEAIQGLALLPYVGPRGRSATGDESQRYDELKHCLKDEETVERFVGYWRRASKAALDETQAIFDGYLRVSALETHWAGLVHGAVYRREFYELPVEKRTELAASWRDHMERPKADPSFLGAPVPEATAQIIPLPTNREAA